MFKVNAQSIHGTKDGNFSATFRLLHNFKMITVFVETVRRAQGGGYMGNVEIYIDGKRFGGLDVSNNYIANTENTSYLTEIVIKRINR